MGLGGMPAVTLKALDALKNVSEERIVTTRDEARETAREILNDKNSPED